MRWLTSPLRSDCDLDHGLNGFFPVLALELRVECEDDAERGSVDGI
jgi:hypothetical protein